MRTASEDIENEKTTQSIIETNYATMPPLEIMDILEYLSRNAKIIFKSQQRNEPELPQEEKLKFALEIYRRNPQTFLIRFGNFLEEKHLKDFARLSIAESDEEMHLMVKDYEYKLKTRQRDIKNRRFTALQKLIEEGEYFSEQEMMKRQPELYQELVGQYLSNKEIKQRDSYDVRNTTFSGILMHDLEQKQLTEIMAKATRTHIEEGSLTNSSDDLTKEDAEIPLHCRQQWGNFDNEQIACSSSKSQNKKLVNNNAKPITATDLITADERDFLRQEFVSQMHEQFLTGQDKDFDYTTVDDNTQYDNLYLINQDKEDRYFDESDEDDEELIAPNKIEDNEESEDELEKYMSHLNNHHSLRK